MKLVIDLRHGKDSDYQALGFKIHASGLELPPGWSVDATEDGAFVVDASGGLRARLQDYSESGVASGIGLLSRYVPSWVRTNDGEYTAVVRDRSTPDAEPLETFGTVKSQTIPGGEHAYIHAAIAWLSEHYPEWGHSNAYWE